MTHHEQQQRQSYLEWLYARSGRRNGLYTGLFQDRLRELLNQDMYWAVGEGAGRG